MSWDVPGSYVEAWPLAGGARPRCSRVERVRRAGDDPLRAVGGHPRCNGRLSPFADEG